MPKGEKTILALLVLSLLTIPASSRAAGPWRPFLKLEAQADQPRLHPFRLALDRQRQRYYLIDAQAAVIFSFTADGKATDRFDAGGSLKQPVAMVRDGQDRLWISDRGANQLLAIGLANRQIERYQLKHRDGRLIVPDRLALDEDGRLYVLDLYAGRILKYNQQLDLEAEFQDSDKKGIISDFRISGDELWTLDPVQRCLQVYSLTGRYLRTVKPESAQPDFPTSFALGSEGSIYLIDRHGGQLVVCDHSGRLRYRFLKKGRNPGQLRYPSDIIFDWNGHLCIADESNGRVEILQR